uniref:Uncharacterized protein n=1 Tax=Cannabis sativa TaxID=3483 RepID=A0A803PVV3_CANSA
MSVTVVSASYRVLGRTFWDRRLPLLFCHLSGEVGFPRQPRLSVLRESASTSVDGFSAWSWSHISSGAHLPLRTYFVHIITKIGIAPFQLIPSSYRLLDGWYVFCKINKLEVPSPEEILYFYGVKANPMRTDRSGLITKYQSIGTVSICGQRQLPREVKEAIVASVVDIITKAAKTDHVQHFEWVLHHPNPLPEEEEILEKFVAAYPDVGVLEASTSRNDTLKSKMLKSWNSRIEVAVDEAKKSYKKRKWKNQTRASWTGKPPPPSTSSSSDVWEILLPTKTGCATPGHSTSGSGGRKSDSSRRAREVPTTWGEQPAQVVPPVGGSIPEAVLEAPTLGFTFLVTPPISHDSLMRAATLKKSQEPEQVTLQKRVTRLSSNKIAQIVNGTRQPLPPGPVLDLPVVSQHLEPLVGKAVAAYAAEMIDSIGRNEAAKSVGEVEKKARSLEEKLTKAVEEKDCAKARMMEKSETILAQTCQVTSLQGHIYKKDLRFKDLEKEMRETAPQLILDATRTANRAADKANRGKIIRKVISMIRGEYLQKYPLIVDSDSGGDTITTTSHSQESTEIETVPSDHETLAFCRAPRAFYLGGQFHTL